VGAITRQRSRASSQSSSVAGGVQDFVVQMMSMESVSCGVEKDYERNAQPRTGVPKVSPLFENKRDGTVFAWIERA